MEMDEIGVSNGCVGVDRCESMVVVVVGFSSWGVEHMVVGVCVACM